MSNIRVVTDIEECENLWKKVMPADLITDLWEIRNCFHQHFNNPPRFIVSEDAGAINGLLPLSWIEESQCCGYFPGETWHGKTWLEQNRIISAHGSLSPLLAQCPGPHHLRYLLPHPAQPDTQTVTDEIGYLFIPSMYDYDIEKYFQEFSPKSRKRLKKDIERLEAPGISYRYDLPDDFEYIADLSIAQFGQDSYFNDQRFRNSFRSLMSYLHDNKLMRITTVLIDGVPAAVDLGCIYKGTYTLLAGGTNALYQGIAKLINLHHMKFACEQKFSSVDFLCGDFSWKILFHLTPRPLYLLSNLPKDAVVSESVLEEQLTHG